MAYDIPSLTNSMVGN